MLCVAIIGGGPAGAAAAVSLLRAAAGAARVVLIERRAFPRPKVCGEFISPAATGLLESMIDARGLSECGARRVSELVIELGNRERSWTLPSPAWALSRGCLDARLLERARDAGAEVKQPARVENVAYADDVVRIQLDGGMVMNADVVIHADGAGRHDPAGSTRMRRGVVGLKCLMRPRELPRGVRMRAARGGYVGTIAVEDGLATVALVVSSTSLRSAGGDVDAVVRAMWPRYEMRFRVSEWLSCGVGDSALVEPGHARSLRIGNAAAAVEPVGGEGIGLALWSGAEAGRLLGEAVQRASAAEIGSALPGIQQMLARGYARRLRWRRPACRAAAEILSRPWACGVMWPLLAAPSVTIRPWYAMTGKPLRGSGVGTGPAIS